MNNEQQLPTTCIKHLAVSGLSSVSARIKSSCNLIGNRFEMPNVSYTQTLAVIIDNVVGTAGPELGYGIFYVIYALAMFIPGLAVGVRRLHDVGKSGWMLLIALIPLIGAIWLLVLMVTDSQQGTNKWGENPKEILA